MAKRHLHAREGQALTTSLVSIGPTVGAPMVKDAVTRTCVRRDRGRTDRRLPARTFADQCWYSHMRPERSKAAATIN